MHYSVYSSSRLCKPMFLKIIGYSSSRIFREFLQTHSNGHRSSSGGWILLIFFSFCILALCVSADFVSLFIENIFVYVVLLLHDYQEVPCGIKLFTLEF